MIQTLLFVAGINTLLQTWLGTRLPVVIGASFAFIIPAISVAFSSRMSVFLNPRQVCLCNHAVLVFISLENSVNLFLVSFFRGLSNPWELFKGHCLLLLLFKEWLDFLDSGEFLEGRICIWNFIVSFNAFSFFDEISSSFGSRITQILNYI